MRKLYILGLIALAAIIIGFAWAEQITLTTYYPAPYGVYRQFTTTGNTNLATQEGNVGIGTTEPESKLDVAGTAQLRGVASGTGLYVNSNGNVGIGTTGPETKATGIGYLDAKDVWLRDADGGNGGWASEGGGAKVYSRMGTTNITLTTQNTWVTITDMSVTLPATFAGGDIYVSFNAILKKSGWLWLRLLLDGSEVLNQVPQWDMAPGSDGQNLPPGVSLSAAKPDLSAGSHTIEMQWKTVGSFGQDGATYPRSMVVITGE